MPKEQIEGWVNIPFKDRPFSIPKSHFESFSHLKVKETVGGDWSVKELEEYSNIQNPRIELILLSKGNMQQRNAVFHLSQISQIEEVKHSQELQMYIEVLEQKLAIMDGPEPNWSTFQRILRLCPNSQLEANVGKIVEEALDGDLFWMAKCSLTFGARLATMRALFAHKYTNDAISAADFVGFPAARSLMLNSIGSFTLYFQPFFLINAPKLGGYSTNRAHATFIYQPNTEIKDQPNTWRSALETLKPFYAGDNAFRAQSNSVFGIESRNICLNWWTNQISDLLWRISSLTRFADESNTYSSSKHFGAVLTLERIFITTVEIMRFRNTDNVICKNLLFELLDLLEGGGMGSYEVNLSVKRQRKIWEQIKSDLPNEFVDIISSRICGAFEAVEGIDAGFWIPSARTESGNILIEKKSGLGKEEIAIDLARGHYLRILRDSHHGFKGIVNDPRKLSYLANHTGSLDERLPDLALWYLIRLLHNPKTLVR